MTNLYDMFETNVDKEQNGVPVKFGDATVYIASGNSTNNKKLAKRKAELIKKKSKLNFGVETEEYEDYLKDLYAECVVVNWENVKGKDGKDLPYSKENVLKLFNELPHFFDKIIQIATDIDTFKDEVREEIAKNS